MKRSITAALILIALMISSMTNISFTPTASAEEFELNEDVEALSYKHVDITDGFFRDYIRQMVCKVVPTAIANVEKPTGGMPNIINAAKKNRGEEHGTFQGMFYVDSDVHKVLESMCYALSVDPMGDEDIINAQADIREKLEEWIPYYLDAQEESGYFDSYFTINVKENKFGDVGKHELYCMGHFMEAAIAHYECTDGTDRRLIDAAIKCADYLCLTFGYGEGQRKQIPGHQEIELALIKLASAVSDMGDAERAEKYIGLSAFLLDVRGNGTSTYWQDHKKVEEQTTAEGHAVRAQYMYTAMAEHAAMDAERLEKYGDTLSSLWQDVTYTKQYVTGGVGQIAKNEGFSNPYYLPNDTAYCETCAGIANMLWNRSMSELYDDSAFADQVETDLYNTVLGCVNFDGDAFYYDNALDTEEVRSAWYGTACCPPNLTRTILSVSGYIYNIGSDSLYVNQYISNKAEVALGGGSVSVDMTSDMPNSGSVSLTLSMESDTYIELYLRMPYWSDKAEVRVNGEAVSAEADGNGYILIEDNWSDGDTVELELSMPVIFEETDEQVIENRGYTSVRRGPLVYCAEYTDNTFIPTRSYVDKTSEPELVWTKSLDGKEDPYGVRDMYIIKLGGYVQGVIADTPVTLTLVPFYARLNREKGPMTVYLAKERLASKSLESYAVPSASYTYRGDSVYNLNDGSNSPNMRWTGWSSEGVRREYWVQYDFDGAVSLSGCEIWWYDDDGGVKLPRSFEIYYKNDETEEFTAVEHSDEYSCKRSDDFSTYRFDKVDVTSLKIVMKPSGAAVGIVEWALIDGDTPMPESKPTDTEPPQTNTQTETQPGPQDTSPTSHEKDPHIEWIIGGIIGIAVVTLGTATVLLITRKRKSGKK